MENGRVYLQPPNTGATAGAFSIRRKPARVDANFINGLHWHDYYELELVTEGRGVHMLDGTAQRIGRGSLYLLSPKDFHSVSEAADAPLSLYNINFSELLLSDALRARLLSAPAPLVLTLSDGEVERYSALLQTMLEEYHARRSDSHEMLSALFSQFLILLLRHASESVETGADVSHLPVARIISYLRVHFRDRVTLADCARMVYLTPNYLGELFRAQVGCSFRQYLQGIRFDYAVELLRGSGLPLEEIGRLSGFSTPSYFAALFRERYGMTPSEYRRTL